MAEKEDRKSKRFQNTQSTPETKIISRNRIKHVNLEAPYKVKHKKGNPTLMYNLTELYMFLNQNELYQIDPNDPASS